MIALYTRISSVDQNIERQKANQKDYGIVIEDRCSGAIPFFERDGGKKMKVLAEKGILKIMAVVAIDRLGRNLKDILTTVEYFTKKKVAIHFISQGIVTLDEDGKENSVAKLIISVLGTVAEMERNQLKERQREGIAIAKAKGVYKGRAAGSKEDALKFLSKEKNKKALELLRKGVKGVDVAKATGLNLNTISKVKKLSFAGLKM